jgi:hypothetical protein
MQPLALDPAHAASMTPKRVMPMSRMVLLQRADLPNFSTLTERGLRQEIGYENLQNL